jgi:DNA-binding transcriptional MerR regulator/methylmalonyl-CoA mutase cobalamin-binding subunit
MDEFLTVKAVSLLSGVSPHTLRAWERRYNAVSPQRTKTGRRVYTFADVERLKLLSRLVDSGYSIGGIARMARDELDGLASKLAPSQAPVALSAAPVAASEGAYGGTIGKMIDALKGYQLAALDQELARARATLPIRTLVLEVFGTLMSEVGDLVTEERIGIAQEHALSAMLRGHLGQIFQSLNARNDAGISVVLSTPEGDLHEFGILMSAILCASHGMAVHYLGPNLPPQDLADAATGTRAHLVILGCTPLPTGAAASPLKSYLKRLTRDLRRDTQVWVGGGGAADPLERSQEPNLRHVPTLVMLDELLSQFNPVRKS